MAQANWDIPVYWYMEYLDRRVGGFTATFRWHWAKPTGVHWIKTNRRYPTMGQIDSLLWPHRWASDQFNAAT